MNNTTIIILILLATNLITFFLFVIDKYKAVKGKWRIPERVLLIWSFFAPWGSFAGMRIAHHKTHKRKFSITVPVFMVLHVAVCAWVIKEMLGA